MFGIWTLACVTLAAVAWLARSTPWVFLYACIGAMAIGFLGVGIICLSGLIVLSASSDTDQAERKLNYSKCANLAWIGVFMISIPILFLFIAAVIPL